VSDAAKGAYFPSIPPNGQAKDFIYSKEGEQGQPGFKSAKNANNAKVFQQNHCRSGFSRVLLAHMRTIRG
jgi:hypothetical protein